MRDYYVSATVRQNGFILAHSWHLWTARIQAHCLSDARAHAILMIQQSEMEYGELQVMWDEAEATIAPARTRLDDSLPSSIGPTAAS